MGEIERIEALYSQGSAEYQEDGFIVNYPFFGVIDGVSAPYHHKITPFLFKGKSGGEMVRKVILETFYSEESKISLEEIILRVNQRIANVQGTSGIPERSDCLAGATFVFAKVNSEIVKIIQGGDCFALWITSSGEIGITRNQVYLHEIESQQIIIELLRKHQGDHQKMWEDFYETLGKFRIRDWNQKRKSGFAILNGNPKIGECWEEITLSLRNLSLLLLFSDGFIPFGREKEPNKVITLYKTGGLSNVLKETRLIAKAEEKNTHITYPEATALAIKFG